MRKKGRKHQEPRPARGHFFILKDGHRTATWSKGKRREGKKKKKKRSKVGELENNRVHYQRLQQGRNVLWEVFRDRSKSSITRTYGGKEKGRVQEIRISETV